MKKVVLLFTPGLDSYLSNSILSTRHDIDLHRVYFDCCRYSNNERSFLYERYRTETGPNGFISSNPEVRIYNNCDLRDIEQENANIPNRNLMFVTLACSIYQDVDEVYINSMKDDRALDSNREIFENYSPILSQSYGHKIKIKSLFWNKEKARAVVDFLADGGSKIDLLMHTYSCFDRSLYVEKKPVYTCLDTVSGNMYIYSGSFFISGCRKCKACFRRSCALTAANIYIPFDNKEIIDSYRGKIDKNVYPERYKTVNNYLEFLDNGPADISI